jgi:hypothetical protein
MIHNLVDSHKTFTVVLGNGPDSMKGDVISFETYDFLIGLDINQVGDLAGADRVLALYNKSNAQTTYIPRPPRYSLVHFGLISAEYDFDLRRYDISILAIENSVECTITCDLQGLIQYVQAHQELIQSQIDSLTAHLEVSISLVNGSIQGYIQAIESMDTAVDSIWMMELDHEVKVQLVENYFRTVKDELHEIYEQAASVNKNDQEQESGEPHFAEMFESMMSLTTDTVILNELTALIEIAQSSQGFQAAEAHLANIINQLKSMNQTNSELYQMIIQFQSMI